MTEGFQQCRSRHSGRAGSAILNLHERIENKLFLDRTRKDSNFKRPHICATLFQTEKCCDCAGSIIPEVGKGPADVCEHTSSLNSVKPLGDDSWSLLCVIPET